MPHTKTPSAPLVQSEQTEAPDALHWSVQQSGARADQHIKAQHPSLSRRLIKELFAKQRILRKGRPIKAHTRLKENDHLTLQGGIPIIAPTPRRDRPLPLVYADDKLLIVNKPSGLACHPLALGEEDSVCHRALAYSPEMAERNVGEARAPGLLHRLDNDTSGVLCFARDTATYEALLQARQEGLWRKWYLGWVAGDCTDDLTLEDPIAHHHSDPSRMVVVTPGTHHRGTPRAATTKVFPLHGKLTAKHKAYQDATPVMIHIDEGVRHQIRVHLAAAGHPILGDKLYQSKPRYHQLHLHAWRLGLPATSQTHALSVRILPGFLLPPLHRKETIR